MPRESSTLGPEAKEFNVVICAFLADNLKAQADALDLFLANTCEYSAIVHIHCFAHMLTLVVSRSPDGGSLSRVVGEIKALQLFLPKREAVSFIGTKCPALVATRWIYLVNILQFLRAHRTVINSYLLIQQTQYPLCQLCISEEVLELLAI
jgi:hypothetical protein